MGVKWRIQDVLSAVCRLSHGRSGDGRIRAGCWPNGVEVLWDPVNRRVKTWESEAPAEPPTAGPRCECLPAILRSGRDLCSAGGRDAAQQELRPSGTHCGRKVMATGLWPNGVEVLWDPVNRRVKTWESEAPAEPPTAGPRCECLPAILRSSRDLCSAGGRDAAQQELRPSGTHCGRKVMATGLWPNGVKVLWDPVNRRVKTWESEAGMVKRC
jgi:hypothetical protein